MSRSGILRKRSVTIAGHRTSLSLEAVFWKALQDAASEEGASVNALVERIDRERAADGSDGNLSSAVRVWLMQRLRERVAA
ncbi:Predicted DNA-binding protein, contains Ribbon-helix-helix (RHH) domain [Tistlia consotensis]|uniref:Predicted DNA-binding protein, contains Ribbon-helix-helix (RHH) domain n=1 Tax=Tistlia consotensis USBA 355 TaxID=560819 RepID=A0A1Y6B317_9PROT|nr:ribbon-helix-helix domain-containing protein [Tistlia consotensis]SME88880.1 Predicted DNA-binding protein, contains Ribbon-helix-helix (RHH) domain [Tistlia consotensis USBA 355]SNR25424.1 Predicted DNA-binding protein, contains Ribbon-helix-helix (RHH) domain [Tistlia consotensis]